MAAPLPAAAAQAPQALMDEIVEEIILRLPPAEPASLVRAALVCKPWCGLISSPRFRRRFRAFHFHRTPPLLGFVCNTRKSGTYVSRFVPTSPYFRPAHADHRDCFALDARRGYVLFSSVDSGQRLLVVWDPFTDERWPLPPLEYEDERWQLQQLSPFPLGINATVLCRASGAGDHLNCIHTFLVVLVSSGATQTTLRVYSSESGCWSQQTVVYWCGVDETPALLVGNTIYFSINMNNGILSYDLATLDTSVIDLPPNDDIAAAALMVMEDDVLGLARAEGSRICLWTMETSSNGGIGWAQTRVIELDKLVSPIYSFAFAPDIGVFFIHGDEGLCSVDLKSEQVKKVSDIDEDDVVSVVPYMSFYTPELVSTTADDGTGVDASSG